MVQITERHIKLLVKWQKAYRFSACVENETALKDGFIRDLATVSEILDYLVEVGIKELNGAGNLTPEDQRTALQLMGWHHQSTTDLYRKNGTEMEPAEGRIT